MDGGLSIYEGQASGPWLWLMEWLWDPRVGGPVWLQVLSRRADHPGLWEEPIGVDEAGGGSRGLTHLCCHPQYLAPATMKTS